MASNLGEVVMTNWEAIALFGVVVWAAAVFKHRRRLKSWVSVKIRRLTD